MNSAPLIECPSFWQQLQTNSTCCTGLGWKHLKPLIARGHTSRRLCASLSIAREGRIQEQNWVTRLFLSISTITLQSSLEQRVEPSLWASRARRSTQQGSLDSEPYLQSCGKIAIPLPIYFIFFWKKIYMHTYIHTYLPNYLPTYIPLHTITYHCIPLHTIAYHYIPLYIPLHTTTYRYIPLHTLTYHYTPLHTSSTAQGGGGSFKNRKPIRRAWLLWIRDGRAKPLMDWKVLDLSHSFSLFLWLSTYLPIYFLCIYLSIDLSSVV